MKFGKKYAMQCYEMPCLIPSRDPKTLRSDADAAHSLPRNQVPEWASNYIDYKGLKKLIKADVRASQSGEKVDLAGKHLDRSTPSLVG